MKYLFLLSIGLIAGCVSKSAYERDRLEAFKLETDCDLNFAKSWTDLEKRIEALENKIKDAEYREQKSLKYK